MRIKTRNKKKNKLPFDLGMKQGDVIHFSNDEYYQYVAVWRVIRLSEVAGLPPVVDRMNVAADILKSAAEKLSMSDLKMAARLVLRVETNAEDETLMRVLSRTRVASMSADLAGTLAQICDNVIKYALPRMVNVSGKRNLFWIEKMRVAIEILSRLVLRLDPNMAEAILDKALEYYRSDGFIRNQELAQPLQNLLKRSWEALPEDRRTKRFFDLLGAPIVGVDNFALIRSDRYDRYPEPGFLPQDDFPPPRRTDDNAGQWRAVLDLLVRGLQSGGEARRRAALRVGSSLFRDQLTRAELSQIAQALWSQEYTKPDDLPTGTMFFACAFLWLPEPEPGIAEQSFRRKWLSHTASIQEDENSLDNIIFEIGMAMHYLRKKQKVLNIYNSELDYIIEMLHKWSHIPIPNFEPLSQGPFFRQPAYQDVLYGLSTLIAEIKIPTTVSMELYKKMQILNEIEYPWFRLAPGFVKILPDKFQEIVSLMKTGLVSEREDLSVNALQGLHLWLERTTDSASKLRKPPKVLITEIGFIIAARRRGALVQALQVAKWIFDAGRDIEKRMIKDLVLQGLGYLTEELRYDREHDQDDHDDQNDIPLQRWCCARLALSMANQGLKDDPVISRWLEIAAQDPLPEVRYVDKTAFAHHYEKK